MRIFPICCLALSAALLMVSCDPPPAVEKPVSTAATQQVFQVKGVIKEIKPDGKTAIIKHEAIPDYMEAMTMPLRVKESRELQGIKAGDAVSFRLIVTETEGWIDQVRRLESTNFVAGTNTNTTAAVTSTSAPAPAPAPEAPPELKPTFRRVREVEPLKVGDAMPDYPFTNQLGQAVTLGQFKGKAVALTFIFTRCPFPEFCPRMSRNFSEAYSSLLADPKGPRNVQFLSLSFDPENDTPEVLRQYGAKYNFDPKYWSYLTGALIEIDAITEQFGLMFPRGGAGFDHNLRTVVIDTQGRVQKILQGNTWTVEELTNELRRAAAVPAEPK